MEICFSGIIPFPIPDSLIMNSQIWGREFSFNKNDKILVMAESGKGKTTFINIMLGTRKDYSGKLYINNRDIKEFSINELSMLRKDKFSIVPQGLMLFEQLTAWENIQLNNKISNFFSDDEIIELLTVFDVIDQKDKKCKQLSFGQNQRIAVIRALCQKYEFLLLDEPFSHLDVKNKEKIWNTICKHANRQNAGIVITSLSDDVNNSFTKKISV